MVRVIMVMVIMVMVIMVILVGNQGASDWGALQGCPTRTGGENLLDWIGTSRWDLVKCFPFDLPGILDTLFSSFWISLEFPDEIFSNVFLSCLLSLLSRDCRVCCSKPTKIWIMWTRWRIWSPAAPTPTPPLKVPITVMSPSLLEIVSVTLVCNLSKSCPGSHAVVVCTEWDEFKTLDWEKVPADYPPLNVVRKRHHIFRSSYDIHSSNFCVPMLSMYKFMENTSRYMRQWWNQPLCLMVRHFIKRCLLFLDLAK